VNGCGQPVKVVDKCLVVAMVEMVKCVVVDSGHLDQLECAVVVLVVVVIVVVECAVVSRRLVVPCATVPLSVLMVECVETLVG
jgi:hypothetical protein